MTVGGNRISVSQATMQFEPAGGGTRLVFTEQDAFLDGYDDAGQREAGMGEPLEPLAGELAGQEARTDVTGPRETATTAEWKITTRQFEKDRRQSDRGRR